MQSKKLILATLAKYAIMKLLSNATLRIAKMAFNQIHRLDLTWSTSKARDTYGYNITRLDDSISGKRYKTCGGGYDMIGTVWPIGLKISTKKP